MAVVDVEDLLSKLTLDEKISLTAGSDFWHTTAVPRLGIPALRLSDGPNGIRGTRFFNGIPAACLPCGTAIGATFDSDLLLEIGHLLAAEARAKGAHVILGPTINIARAPLGGRGFESYSEDPVLSGILAGYYCKGIKEKNIIATLKHFVCNDQEHERMAVNSILTQRALREIYLLPFQVAIKLSQPGAVMTAYNKVNGTHVSENKHIIKDILRDEWKWDGLVMSDWFGTYSTSEAISAGLDLEMPGPTRWRGATLAHAVMSKKLQESELDERVRAVLKMVNLASSSGIPEGAEEKTLDRPEDRALLRRIAAQSVVLLKNEQNVLPFDKSKTIAVIGPNAKATSYCGGGSASLAPYYAISPFEGVAAQSTGDVKFAQGAYAHQNLPLLGEWLRTADGKQGFSFKVYNEPVNISSRTCIDELHLTNSLMFFMNYTNPKLGPEWYADMEGIYTPDRDGTYDFGLAVSGTARLFVDDKLVVDNTTDQKPGASFFGSGTEEVTRSIDLEAGKGYKITIKWGCAATSSLKRTGIVSFGPGGCRFGACRRLDPKDAIAEAVKLASETEQVVVFAGLNGEWETEGQDRVTMDLPPNSDDLITAVLKVNPKAVIVIQSGTPVTMPWVDNASSVVQAWYGGNETGNGIADVLYGDTNPSGKLPLTFPRRLQDNPAFINYRSEAGRTLYGEDIYVGYRWYDKVSIAPLFAFGHGLSYTSFSFSNLSVSTTADEVIVSVEVQNTGSRTGAETVQVYIAASQELINRPIKELKGFKKVLLDARAKKSVVIKLDKNLATSYWDEEREAWSSPNGIYKVLVGNSSDAKFLEARFEVCKSHWWTGL